MTDNIYLLIFDVYTYIIHTYIIHPHVHLPPHPPVQMSKYGPKIKDTVNILCSALEAYGHPTALFVGHSLGAY